MMISNTCSAQENQTTPNHYKSFLYVHELSQSTSWWPTTIKAKASIAASLFILLSKIAPKRIRLPLQILSIVSSVISGTFWNAILVLFNGTTLNIFLNCFWFGVGILIFGAAEKWGMNREKKMIRVANFVNYKRPGFRLLPRSGNVYTSPLTQSQQELDNKTDKALLESDMRDEEKRKEMEAQIHDFWVYCLLEYLLFKVVISVTLVLFIFLNEKWRYGYLLKTNPIFMLLAVTSAFYDDMIHDAAQERPSDSIKNGRPAFVIMLNLTYYQAWKFVIARAIRAFF